MSLFDLFKKAKKEYPVYTLSTKVFYAAEAKVLEEYFPLTDQIYNSILAVYDNQRTYLQYYFDGATPVAVILWLDDWKSKLSEEDRLELFTLMDEPVTKSAYIEAFEVNKYFRGKDYGRQVLLDFVKDKKFISLSAKGDSSIFYKKCGFQLNQISDYYYFENK